jgi:hypothetical protein
VVSFARPREITRTNPAQHENIAHPHHAALAAVATFSGGATAPVLHPPAMIIGPVILATLALLIAPDGNANPDNRQP